MRKLTIEERDAICNHVGDIHPTMNDFKEGYTIGEINTMIQLANEAFDEMCNLLQEHMGDSYCE